MGGSQAITRRHHAKFASKFSFSLASPSVLVANATAACMGMHGPQGSQMMIASCRKMGSNTARCRSKSIRQRNRNTAVLPFEIGGDVVIKALRIVQRDPYDRNEKASSFEKINEVVFTLLSTPFPPSLVPIRPRQITHTGHVLSNSETLVRTATGPRPEYVALLGI
jgi:hypothetical protein